MSSVANALVFENVSKFYGEVLGVNRIDLAIGPASPVSWDRTVPARRR